MQRNGWTAWTWFFETRVLRSMWLASHPQIKRVWRWCLLSDLGVCNKDQKKAKKTVREGKEESGGSLGSTAECGGEGGGGSLQ